MAEKDNGVFIREISLRYKKKRVPKKAYYCIGKSASNPEKVAKIFYKQMQQETVEKFIVIHLNSQNEIESFQTVSIGTVDQTMVYKKEVFKAAVIANCNAIICLHNHPSGNCKPSTRDKEINEELKAAGKLLSIKVLDHVIIGKGSYYSLTHTKKYDLYGMG